MDDERESEPDLDSRAQTEAEISAELVADLHRLGDRCLFRPEVRMLCWTHARKGNPDPLRIDFIMELDGRILGIEVKRAPARASELGQYLLQASQYAVGVIAANAASVPQKWTGRPVEAVFVRTKLTRCDDFMKQHAMAAHRLFGPANVGFVTKESRGLCLRLCGERFWTQWSGYHQGMLAKITRVGSGKFGAS
jgi:hypothetical protein